MIRILQDVRTRLDRNKGRSFGELVKKGVGYAVGTVRARVALRQCDAVGPGARVTGRPRIVNDGKIVVGNDLILMSTWNPVELVTGPEGRIEIGNGCAINFGTSIRAEHLVSIGDDAMIGQYCILGDRETPHDGAARPVTIGKRAWLAGRVTVLPGVTIGEGAVVTAGSIVEADIPAGVMAGGIPARVLRKLNGVPPARAVAGIADAEAPPRGTAMPGAEATRAVDGSARPHSNGASAAEAPAAMPVEPRKVEERGLVLADFTGDELARRLTDDDSERPVVDAAPGLFGQVTQTLMAGIEPGEADFAVVWTRPDAALPSFARVLSYETVSDAELIADVDAFCDLVVSGCAKLRAAFVPSWTLPPWQRGLGMIDARTSGATHALACVNQRLVERLEKGNAYVLNTQRWLDAAGRGAHTAKGWYLGKVPFATEVFVEAARDVKAALRGLTGMARKLLVVDLDDTLWGGIVGDVGWQGLRLGGHDAAGEAFVDFQRQLKNLARRGIVLAIVSKNEESVALEAIASHPEMVLRKTDFVGHRINWLDKARNLAELAQELNLGLQSVVFIDDNPVERARVREALPEVLVPEWPSDPVLYPSALSQLRCFDAPALSREDSGRTRMYAEEKEREALKAAVSDIDEWLKSLCTKVRAERLNAANLARTTQLLNKTNQMNLTTRRLTERELSEWAAQPGHSLHAISVSDKFGDAGLTGIVSVETNGGVARVVDFVLSCRVMGRRIENAMLHLAVNEAFAFGADRVEARLVPTAKNKPCREVLKKSGFEEPEADLFVWDAKRQYTAPVSLELELAR